jgi:hypothetical protein
MMNWILQCKIKQGSERAYSVTLSHIGVKCIFLFIVVGINMAVCYIKVFIVSMDMQD